MVGKETEVEEAVEERQEHCSGGAKTTVVMGI